MARASVAKVSHRGQTNVPAELRRRWGIDDGGDLGFIDLGGAALVVPGGIDGARRELRRVLSERYDAAVDTLTDPDLADQMARMAADHPKLNLLNLEAAAAALTLSAEVWLSEPATRGVLPDVLDGEGIRWRVVPVA